METSSTDDHSCLGRAQDDAAGGELGGHVWGIPSLRPTIFEKKSDVISIVNLSKVYCTIPCIPPQKIIEVNSHLFFLDSGSSSGIDIVILK